MMDVNRILSEVRAELQQMEAWNDLAARQQKEQQRIAASVSTAASPGLAIAL
jgi:hypothetical protein